MSRIRRNLDKINEYVDAHQSLYIRRLSDSVAIQSVSSLPEKREEVRTQIQTFANWLQHLGGTYELVEPGIQTLPDGSEVEVPPICFGKLGQSPSKKTILIYGHLDVHPAARSDGWDTEPFVLTERDGKLYGRGASDDKGPCLAWLNIVEAFKEQNIELPVNLKFIFEGMLKSGSVGLDEAIAAKKGTPFIKNVDYVCISDNYWLGKEKPCLTYGLRGVCHFHLEVVGGSKDLHSGIYGGSVHEAMSELIYVMDNLVTREGRLMIPGIYDDVAELTMAEAKLYENIDFDIDEFKSDIGASELLQKTKETILQHRWRFPSLSLHGIEGANSDPGDKTVIPCKVVGKFSIRIVPNMTVEKVAELVTNHVENLWAVRGSPNSIKCEMTYGGTHWLSPFDSPHYEAAKRAIVSVHGKEPDLIREGGSIPVTATLQEATGKSTLLLPFGMSDDGAHSQNEKFNVSSYMNGMKVTAAYFYEVSQLT